MQCTFRGFKPRHIGSDTEFDKSVDMALNQAAINRKQHFSWVSAYFCDSASILIECEKDTVFFNGDSTFLIEALAPRVELSKAKHWRIFDNDSSLYDIHIVGNNYSSEKVTEGNENGYNKASLIVELNLWISSIVLKLIH